MHSTKLLKTSKQILTRLIQKISPFCYSNITISFGAIVTIFIYTFREQSHLETFSLIFSCFFFNSSESRFGTTYPKDLNFKKDAKSPMPDDIWRINLSEGGWGLCHWCGKNDLCQLNMSVLDTDFGCEIIDLKCHCVDHTVNLFSKAGVILGYYKSIAI